MPNVTVQGVPLGPELSLKDSVARFVEENNISIIFSGSDKTLEASRKLCLGSSTQVVDLNDQETGIRATDIRNSIQHGTALWRDRLTPSTVKYIESLLPQLQHRLTFLPDGQKRPWVEGARVSSPERR